MCTTNGCALHDGEVHRVITRVHPPRKYVHECVLTMDLPHDSEVLRVITTVHLSRKYVHECVLTMDVPFMIARYSESLLGYTFQENVCMNVYYQWMCPS